MTEFGKRLLQSVDEARAIARGDMAAAKTVIVEGPDVAAIRKRLKLSQDKFARQFGLRTSTVRDWKQGRRRPDASACILLKVIDYAPETVARAVAASN